MMGKLIWLMGPSGSGKDSLLAELRLREQTQLLVAHRYITRDASAGSENHIARCQSALLPVCLQVSPEILRQRLENRGRENASEINARLARAARYTPQDCHTLNNDGSLRQSVDTLLTLIHQKEKHHACL